MPKLGEQINPGALDGIVIPFGLLGASAVSLGAKICWGVLVRLSSDNYCAVRVQDVAELLSVDKRQVRRYLTELEDLGILKREGAGGRDHPNRYFFHRHPSVEGGEFKAKVLDLYVRLYGPERVTETSSFRGGEDKNVRVSDKNVRLSLLSSSSSKNNTSDDDETDGGAVACPRNDADAEQDREEGSPVEIFCLRMRNRHGPDFAWRQALRAVEQELSRGNVTLEHFLALDTLVTTQPGRLLNPPGHYRMVARELVIEAKNSHHLDVGALYRKLDSKNKFQYRCPQGCDQGIGPDGVFCSCKAGQTLAEIQERQRTGELRS